MSRTPKPRLTAALPRDWGGGVERQVAIKIWITVVSGNSWGSRVTGRTWQEGLEETKDMDIEMSPSYTLRMLLACPGAYGSVIIMVK